MSIDLLLQQPAQQWTNLYCNSITATTSTTGGNIVYLNAVQTLTNKSLDSLNCQFVDDSDNTKIINTDSSLATTSTILTLQSRCTGNRTITFPDATDTLVNLHTTQTLTNKSLTSPSISNPILLSPTNDNTQTRLLALNGTNNVIYRNSTTIPVLTNLVISLAGTQSLSTATFTTVKFDTISTSSPYLTYSTSTGIFTCVSGGIYTFCSSIQLSAGVSGQRIITFIYNSNSIQTVVASPIGADSPNLGISTTIIMVPSDTIIIQAFQDSGSTLNILGSTANSTLCSRINVTGIINS
jgi:hypothetical protein